jgi:putative membrane protein
MKMKCQSLAMCLVFVLAAFGLAACNRDRGVEAARDNVSAVSAADQDFMLKATQANVGEIDMARLALQKTSNGDVKDYANMIEKDHTKALDNLTELMKEQHVELHNAAPVEAEHEMSSMNNLSGSEFDREFINKMVTDHQKAVQMFKDEQGSAQDPQLKKYVDDVLPKLETHLEMAQQLQSKLFSTSSNASR